MSASVKLLVITFVIYCAVESVYAPTSSYASALGRKTKGRDVLIKAYFNRGYTYKEILLFLACLHGIKLSLSWLKQIIRRLGLRRQQVQTQESLKLVVRRIKEEIRQSGKPLNMFCLKIID